MNAIERQILRKLAGGPVWARSLHDAKAVVQGLIGRGYVARCKPPGGRGANMLELTDKGLASIDEAQCCLDDARRLLEHARQMAGSAIRVAADRGMYASLRGVLYHIDSALAALADA